MSNGVPDKNGALEALVSDLKLWACSPRVPLKAQLVMLEAIGRLASAPSAIAPTAEDPGTIKLLTALVERAYGIFTASGVLRVAEQDPDSNDPIVAWASDVRSILYRNKPAAIDVVLQSIRRSDGEVAK